MPDGKGLHALAKTTAHRNSQRTIFSETQLTKALQSKHKRQRTLTIHGVHTVMAHASRKDPCVIAAKAAALTWTYDNVCRTSETKCVSSTDEAGRREDQDGQYLMHTCEECWRLYDVAHADEDAAERVKHTTYLALLQDKLFTRCPFYSCLCAACAIGRSATDNIHVALDAVEGESKQDEFVHLCKLIQRDLLSAVFLWSRSNGEGVDVVTAPSADAEIDAFSEQVKDLVAHTHTKDY